MGYAEKRGNLYRARWRGPTGVLEQQPGFSTKRDAESYANDQEAAIRGGTYIDPRAGQTTLTEWVNLWFPAQDLEPSTLADYRNRIEVRILPTFGDRTLSSITAEEVALWEKGLVAAGYATSTARAARSLLGTILADAIPRYLQINPAVRRRGKGRKGANRVARLEKTETAWSSPLQALLIAERCAALSGRNAEFLMIIMAAYTGVRWSELLGLQPARVHKTALDVHSKLYELGGRFYRGYPKDGSRRTIDIPPFLSALLHQHLEAASSTRCTCRPVTSAIDDIDWCPGDESYVFLGPKYGHHRRSNFARRFLRPAADGWHPKTPRCPALPVLVDASELPGSPLAPWPAATAPAPPPRARRRGPGHALVPDTTPLGSWLPILTGLTPHGLRHGHQTWMDEAGVAKTLKSERMGHELPGIQAVYSHVTPDMRADLLDTLEQLWTTSLAERVALGPRSTVPMLNQLLADLDGSSHQDPLPNGSQKRTSESRSELA